jgi:hypothetical protein
MSRSERHPPASLAQLALVMLLQPAVLLFGAEAQER